MAPHSAARLATIAALALALAPATTGAWVIRSHGTAGYGVATSIALAPDGNPIVAGSLSEPDPVQSEAHVAKHDASDGSEIWRYDSGGDGGDVASSVIVDSAGDAFVILTLFRDTDVYDVSFVKISGADGTELWRRDFAGPGYQFSFSLVLTSDGDAVVALMDGPSQTTATVMRLDGATGVTVWSAPFVGTNGFGQVNAIALDAADDIFVVGGAQDATATAPMRVAKLDGTTGAEQWRSALASSHFDSGFAIAVDHAGDVVVAGQNQYLQPPDFIATNQFPFVAKFAGATGAQLWQLDDLTGDPDHLGTWATALAIDAGDDVYATGLGSDSSLLALHLDGGSGAIAWRRDLTGVASDLAGIPSGVGQAVVIDAGGVPVFGGEVGNRFSAFGLDPATGATLWLQDLPGDNHNGGRIYGLALDPAGYVFAAGYSTFPLIPNNSNQTNEYTVVRWVNPLSPPANVGNCTAAPRLDCRAAPSRKSSLQLKDAAGVRRDLIKWKWTAADATATADFGDPLAAGNDFTLCIYDGTSAQIFGAVVAGDNGCTNGVPCWRTLGTTGFRYRAKIREVDGVNDLSLQSGAPSKGHVKLKRKGRELGDLPMPNLSSLALPLTVQLQRDAAPCFGATFSIAGTSDATKFSAKSD